MIIYEDGRIGYHSLVWQKDFSLVLVQYDKDGNELYREEVRSAPLQIESSN
jgi:hypothetical protein